MPRRGVLWNAALHDEAVVGTRNVGTDAEAKHPPENPMRVMPDDEDMCEVCNQATPDDTRPKPPAKDRRKAKLWRATIPTACQGT